MAPVLTPLAQVSIEQVRDACGPEPSWACEPVLELTGNETAAQIVGWALDAPLRILLIVVGAFVLSRLLRRAVRSALRKMAATTAQRRQEAAASMGDVSAADRALVASRAEQRLDAISTVLQSSAVFVLYLLAGFMILGEIGVNLAPLLAGAGVVGLALGFGAQSLVRDFFTGLFILLEDQYAVGDIVDLGEATGTVESVSLRTTRLRAVDGVVWHVPNGEITRVGNMSQHWSRALLDIEVAYATDLDEAKRLIAEVARTYAEGDDCVLEPPEVWGVEALGASGIVIRLVVKTRPSEQWRISRELRERIKAEFDRAGVEIPFPQQTVWMHAAGEGEQAA
jgi:moderate conductance mechanosensitive channel